MKLCSPSGVVPANSVANQLTMTAKNTAMPHRDSQMRWGMTRIRRKATVSRFRSQVVRERQADRVRRGASVHGAGL